MSIFSNLPCFHDKISLLVCACPLKKILKRSLKSNILWLWSSEEEIEVDYSWQDTQRFNFHGLDFNLIARRVLRHLLSGRLFGEWVHPNPNSTLALIALLHTTNCYTNCNSSMLATLCWWPICSIIFLLDVGDRVTELRHGWTSAQELRHKFLKISLTSAQINFGTSH